MTSNIGHGFGLRTSHYPMILEHGLPVRFAEVITENFLGRGGRPRAVLERARADAAIALHGVSLSIGSVDPLNIDYLMGVKDLRDRIEAAWISDHLCFGSFGGHQGHDLWPLPYTEESVRHVVDRVRRVQDILGEQILLENISSYVSYRTSTMTEWDFFREVLEHADCFALLDINNIVVNAFNHGFCPLDYVRAIPPARVRQFHLAGHQNRDSYLFDDHGSAVPENVWAVYQVAVRRFGPVPCIVEWDDPVPAWNVLVAQAQEAAAHEREALASPDQEAA